MVPVNQANSMASVNPCSRTLAKNLYSACELLSYIS